MALSVQTRCFHAIDNVRGTSTRRSCSALVRKAHNSRPVVAVNAVKDNSSAATPLALIPAAFAAACLVCSAVAPPAAHATAGSELTKNLIESGGTSDASKPTTGVPFQAPGIGKSPRGAAQDQGTNLKETLKGAGRQIKENNKDPDSAPFGVGKGPLVRNAKKMDQPNLTRSSGNAPSELFKQQTSSSRPIESVREDPSKVLDNRGVLYPLVEKTSGQ